MTDIFQTLARELADAQTLYDNEHVEHEATQADRDHAYLRLTEAWEWTSTGPSGSTGRSLAEVLEADQKAIWAALCRDPDTGGTEDLPGAVAEAIERLPAAADALRSYLVSIGHPSDPVTSADLPPALWNLAEWLL